MRRLAIFRHHDLHALDSPTVDSPTDPLRPAQTRVMKTAPVPTKQNIAAPLGQKTSIAVKSPAQGTKYPADIPLTIICDRSAIGIDWPLSYTTIRHNLYGGKKHTVATASGSV